MSSFEDCQSHSFQDLAKCQILTAWYSHLFQVLIEITANCQAFKVANLHGPHLQTSSASKSSRSRGGMIHTFNICYDFSLGRSLPLKVAVLPLFHRTPCLYSPSTTELCRHHRVPLNPMVNHHVLR